jgi:hypothetical protein
MDSLNPGKVFRIRSFIYEMRGGIAQSVQRLGYELDDRGSILHMGQKIFLFFIVSRLALGPNKPSTQWVPRDLTPEEKRHGREAHHSPPSNSEGKNTSVPPYTFVA